MHVALLTEGDRGGAEGRTSAWCDRLVRRLADHDFAVYAVGAAAGECPEGTRRLPLDGPPPAGRPPRRAARRRFLDAYGEMADALARAGGSDGHQEDRFSSGLYGLARCAERDGGLPAALRSEAAARTLEATCRAPGADPLAASGGPAGLLAARDALERALRPLSAPWYGPDALGAADLCHATSVGPAALPGLLAAHRLGTPLLVTEYAVRLRAHYLASRELPPPERALTSAFHRLLAAGTYRAAALITPGDAHIRRWQERCGAPHERLRTVHPGMDAGRLAQVGEAAEAARRSGDGGAREGLGARTAPTLLWTGRVEPGKDLVALLHAFTSIRAHVPGARLRIAHGGPADPDHLARCRTLAAQLFPDEAADTSTPGENPVVFTDLSAPGAPALADVHAAADLVVLSSAVEGFPVTLVEAMFCGRATVSTDTGAVREVVGGTGLVVPPRNPRALAEACAALLRDPERRSRLGAAARARAVELFSAEQNATAFRAMYRDLAAGRVPATAAAPVPFATTAEAVLPAAGTTGRAPRPPAWARRRVPATVGGDLA
ncbi:glycosyltransferase [Streptomyces sp. PTM05]|uniref:D-inositol 3-phosphate glycosyltransferase n=1 Tax=Streptantibioticus parmotrematis TaxID=2873249 RepID=A0ABS7QN54_9ACTN|nr:glycosyltransferase [Streptantibioticus parmotrematis]MBY8884206.1 glycosyltransferase [Streptantibioticus parmotrematis]